jgi:hypothetical protein
MQKNFPVEIAHRSGQAIGRAVLRLLRTGTAWDQAYWSGLLFHLDFDAAAVTPGISLVVAFPSGSTARVTLLDVVPLAPPGSPQKEPTLVVVSFEESGAAFPD